METMHIHMIQSVLTSTWHRLPFLEISGARLSHWLIFGGGIYVSKQGEIYYPLKTVYYSMYKQLKTIT